MKRLTHFESSIIGLFVGVIFASYLAYLEAVGKVAGKVLSFISFLPVLNSINIPDTQKIIFSFLFVIIVFIIYGFIIGLIMRNGIKTKILIICIIIVLIISIFIEQKNGTSIQSKQNQLNIVSEVSYVKPARDNSTQYFNKDEAWGDLNGDNKNDIAFVIPREDKTRGNLYYFTAALTLDDGSRSGSNLIFLGDNMEPKKISIEEGRVVVEYVNRLDKKSTTTKEMYAEFVDGIFKQVKVDKTTEIIPVI